MSSSVQEELSRDQFVEALGPGQVWSQVRLLHPQNLQVALEMAHERETVWAWSGRRRLTRVFKNAYIPSNKLLGRTRKAGEPLLELAQAIEGLTRRAFVHMSSSVQEELSRDQFVEALGPGQLWSQVRLLHPQNLQVALEMAHERETVWAWSGRRRLTRVSPAPVRRKWIWLPEVTALTRAVAAHDSEASQWQPLRCWGCGQTSHRRAQCPEKHRPGEAPSR
ncbi:UNVERIFIED_CONTAM: hypothetical protein FKN15_028289 [Acipenser sinensis]